MHRRVSVFDQGALGSCTGNAIVGVGATAPYRRADVRYGQRLAVRVYKRATVLDEFDGIYPPQDTGSSGLAAAKAAVEYGIASGYRWAFGAAELARGLVEVGSFAVGTLWMSGMDVPDADGVVHATGHVRGGHEYQAIGWHGDVKQFECVNSWGRGWGVKGRFRIGYDEMDALLNRAGDCVTLIP